MKLNGSWAILPGILAFTGLFIIVLVNVPHPTEMSEQVTKVAVSWMAAWGMAASVGLMADYRSWAKTARYPFFEYFLSEWLQRL